MFENTKRKIAEPVRNATQIAIMALFVAAVSLVVALMSLGRGESHAV